MVVTVVFYIIIVFNLDATSRLYCHFHEGLIYFMVLYCIVLYCIALYCIALCCIALYCAVLYCHRLWCECVSLLTEWLFVWWWLFVIYIYVYIEVPFMLCVCIELVYVCNFMCYVQRVERKCFCGIAFSKSCILFYYYYCIVLYCIVSYCIVFSAAAAVLAELRHHRHWQSALEHLSGCQFSMLPHMMPSQGMILGGTISLRGRNLTLASFHGINFRSRYWALFNIQHPYILFSTEAQKMEDEGQI